VQRLHGAVACVDVSELEEGRHVAILSSAVTRRVLKIAASATAAAAFAAAAQAQPDPNVPLPTTPAAIAAALSSTNTSVRAAVDGWPVPRGATPPQALTLFGLYDQRLVRLLAAKIRLRRGALRSLRPTLRARVHDLTTAHAELVRITPPLRTRVPHVGRAAPPDDLLRWYREGQRRFGIPWRVLAAVNFVESAFGKLRSASAAGAQGPMQFMPATWRAYGLGGDVHDARDAILGAANYLRASGGRNDLARALHAYNPSPLYVDAVLRYARELGADAHVFYELYSWQVYVRTRSGAIRLTGPGRH
jgi:Transglycosylase SLT domain